ncbi:MAG: hypothetical protein LQ343_000376 [Gyalolechia ehrenbergii]|nr:MAG: hypothetical protein LQ343_000376 [Gyalolechia ehrenbergii]
MKEPFSPDQLPSLSATSPINNITGTEDTFVPPPNHSQRIRKHQKSDAQTRERRVAAAQSAKREILAKVREDWTWPPSTEERRERFPRRRKSTKWREREDDSSPLASRSPSPGCQDPYRFESPDSVVPLFVSRRNKSLKLLEEELEWNVGLKVFNERRDFWTGAETRSMSAYQTQKRSSGTVLNPARDIIAKEETVLPSIQTSPECAKSLTIVTIGAAEPDSSSTPVSNQSLGTSACPHSSFPSLIATPHSPETLPSYVTANPFLSQPASNMSDTESTILVPLAPPLLPPTDHPDLGEITPAIYPTIYSKCVIQSVTPSFPINLKDMVGSLVQGWKEDGEWPPKSSVQADAEKSGPRRESLKEKMKGLRVDGEEVRLDRVARKGVGKVKRALGR